MADSYAALADCYDLLLPEPLRNTTESTGWLAGLLRPLGVVSVLDCSCGTGIQATALARLGYVVTASDVSKRMLGQARRRIRDAGVSVTVARADMRSLEAVFARPFDVVLSTGSALLHLTRPDDLRRTILGMGSVTKSDGYCLLALADQSAPDPSIFRRVETPDGTTISLLTTAKRRGDKLSVRLFLTRDSAGGPMVSTRLMRLRIPTRAELVALLDDAGFTEIVDRSEPGILILLGHKR